MLLMSHQKDLPQRTTHFPRELSSSRQTKKQVEEGGGRNNVVAASTARVSGGAGVARAAVPWRPRSVGYVTKLSPRPFLSRNRASRRIDADVMPR